MIQEHQKLIRVRSGDKQLTCIVCPIGCRMAVDRDTGGSLAVSGNRCRRGEDYAAEEFTDPRRVVTATAAINHGNAARLPVRSSSSVPVNQVAAFLTELYSLRLEAPIVRGEKVAVNLAGTGIDLMATMSVPRISG